MEVYIEYAIIDNMTIDLLILVLTSKLNKLDVSKLRLTLTALFGTIIALISPLLSGIFLILAKLLCGLTMPLLLLKKPKFKLYIIVMLSFLLITAIFGGVCLAICSFFNLNFQVENGAIMVYSFPVGLALIIAFIMFYIIKNLIKHFSSQKRLAKFLYDVWFLLDNTLVKTSGFLDSGNKLSDQKSGKPITLINFELFSKLTDVKLSDVLLKKYDKIPLKNVHEVELKSLTKSSKIMVFEIDNILIDNTLKIEQALVGLSVVDFQNNLQAECILSPDYFN